MKPFKLAFWKQHDMGDPLIVHWYMGLRIFSWRRVWRIK